MKRHAIIVLAATLLSAPAAAPEVEITSEPHHHLAFENKSVRVFNVEVAPNTKTQMHWHRHDYIYVTLGPAEISNVVKDKPPVTVKLQDGETRFSAATFAHIAHNLSDQTFRNVTIEILQDEALRQSTVRWDEDRGLDVLGGGTKQILFVKDGVRATEFELQPNAVVPSSPHSHPMLLIAISDLNIFTNDPRTHGGREPSPTSHHFNSGGSHWLPLGFKQPIVNAGPHNAKFVTLEFP
jgi:hypothetical protein